MAEIFSLLLVGYIMSAGFGLIVNGPRGMQRVNRFWFRTITGIIGWTLDQLGNGLKALGRTVRR